MSNLILPRVRVTWGDVNLSAYNGPGDIPQGESIVFNVTADLSSENEAPSASMDWNPSGAAMAIYEEMVESYLDKQIVIEYFYSGGKKINMIYMWSGQSISYGNDMTIRIKMVSELAGRVNGNIRNTAQAYDEKKGTQPTTLLKKTVEQFGEKDSLFKLTENSEKYWKQVKLQNMYGSDWTLGNAAASIAKQTGDGLMATNIKESAIVIYSPFSDKGADPEKVEIATASSPNEPEVTKRVAYILGPSIISTINRSSNWKPPQQSNSTSPGRTVRARDPETGRFVKEDPEVKANKNIQETAKATSAPLGTTNNRSNLSIQNTENPRGADRANALNDEKGSEMQLDTFMCPLLCGVKPNDVLYIPSLNGKFIEDWVVQSVEYKQSSGGVDVSLRATRTYGAAKPMNETAAKEVESFAKDRKLIGPDATLEAWDEYAWEF